MTTELKELIHDLASMCAEHMDDHCENWDCYEVDDKTHLPVKLKGCAAFRAIAALKSEIET